MDELEQLVETPDSDAAHTAAAEEHEQQAGNHDDNVDPDSQEQPEEDEEIEIDGKKFALPKSAAQRLQSERLMQQDYTRKTQEVAEGRKALEAEREQAKAAHAQQQQFIKEIAKVQALDDELAKFNGIDWDGLSDTDPVTVQKLQIRLQALQNERHQAAQAVTTKQNEYALQEQQATAKQLQEAEAYVQREIPGWTNERGAQINKFAADMGVKVDRQFAQALIQNPALMKILDQAEKFSQLVAKQAAKPKAPTAPPAPPTRVSASRASAKPDPAKQSDADWYAARKEQQRKR